MAGSTVDLQAGHWSPRSLRAGLAIGDSKVICVSRESGYDEPFLGGGFLWQTFNSLQ
jgi:hypothetical protein